MHNIMIKLLDEIYLTERKKHDEVTQILINPHYAYFNKFDKQKSNVNNVKKKYNQQLNTMYEELNEHRNSQNYKSLDNPYKERN